MSRIERSAVHENQAWNAKAALPVLAMVAMLAMLAACFAGCAGTMPAGGALAPDALTSKPTARFSTCEAPRMPLESQRRNSEGTSTLRYLINVDGTVAESHIQAGSGDRMLDVAARDAIAKCLFTPALKDGKPASAWVTIWYVWKLQ